MMNAEQIGYEAAKQVEFGQHLAMLRGMIRALREIGSDHMVEELLPAIHKIEQIEADDAADRAIDPQ